MKVMKNIPRIRLLQLVRNICILLFFVSLVNGCRSDEPSADVDHRFPICARIHTLQREGRYHEALLELPELWQEMKDVEEDALGFEVDWLVNQVAMNGQDQWEDIFVDPKVSYEVKSMIIYLIDVECRSEQNTYEKK